MSGDRFYVHFDPKTRRPVSMSKFPTFESNEPTVTVETSREVWTDVIAGKINISTITYEARDDGTRFVTIASELAPHIVAKPRMIHSSDAEGSDVHVIARANEWTVLWSSTASVNYPVFVVSEDDPTLLFSTIECEAADIVECDGLEWKKVVVARLPGTKILPYSLIQRMTYEER